MGVVGVLSRRTVLKGSALTAAAAVAGPVLRPAAAVAAEPPLVGSHRTLPSGRRYWLSGTGGPLVVGCHGSNLTASNVNAGVWVTGTPATTGWQQHAAANGYTLALAEGLPGMVSWNVGGGWPSGSQDDLGYLLDVAADAVDVAGAGPDTFIGGFSAGAALAWRAACDHPEVFAACGSGSGWAPAYPSHPVDCWHTHGTADGTVPIRGGYVPTFPYTFPPAYDEAARAPRGSRVVLEVSSGGHATPGWLADRWWQFWVAGR